MIVVVDYGMGNLGSIVNMLKRIGVEVQISCDPTVIRRADSLILPGVGAFQSGMRNLEARGLVKILEEKVLGGKTPILGLCLGMQLFGQHSEEGEGAGLGWLQADTVHFRFGQGASLRVPHMGWNMVRICRKHALLTGIEDCPRFYFVHSYHLVCYDPDAVVASAEYGYDFPAIVAKDNIMGVQFHPEKSHRYGMQLLGNFISLRC